MKDRESAVVTDLQDMTLTLSQVAAKHGISYSTVLRLTKKYNLAFRKPGRPWGSKSKRV